MDPAAFEIPGFSAEQVSSIFKLIEDTLDKRDEAIERALNKALDKLGRTLDTALELSVPQPAQQEQEKLLPQAIVENTAESTSGSSRPIDTSLLPTMPGQTARQLCREWTPYTGFLASFLASSLASLFGFGSFLASFLAPLLASQLGYIRCIEGIEAIGQG